MFQINSLNREELEKRAAAGKLRGIFRVAEDDYHGGPGWSSTRLKRVLRSPAHAAVPTRETEALIFGRAFHCALLEPERFAEAYIEAPRKPAFEHDGRTAAGKKERQSHREAMAAWSALYGGKTVLDADDFSTIDAMARAATGCQTLQRLVVGAQFEVAAYWTDADTGVLCKAKADIWNGSVITDLKSTMDASPGAFRRALELHFYDLSAALYSDGFSQLLGKVSGFVWAACEKEEPYGVACYVADDEMIRTGRELYKAALARVARIPSDAKSIPCYPDELQAISPSPASRRRIPVEFL